MQLYLNELNLDPKPSREKSTHTTMCCWIVVKNAEI